MCRLAIIDVRSGQQPSQDPSGRIISVFNGEIYNFKELRDLLIKRGYVFTGSGDSECIPNLYREFGDNFPKYLQGMFAIALWDEERRRGLLVRDRVGKKPLWYKSNGKTTCFASELKGLHVLSGNLEFDQRRLPEFLQFGYINAPRSIYKEVQQLKPGTILVLDENGIRESHYWQIPETNEERLDFREAKLKAKSLITDAVKLRLVSERPVGAFLSGGIDSSLITALMARELGAETHSYSIGFKNRKYDESSYAREVAQFLGVTHHEKVVSPDPNVILRDLAQVLDQPFADSSIVPTFLLGQFARKDVVVALGGDGGDEVFGGYTRYRAARQLNRLNLLLVFVPTPLLKKLQLKDRRIEKLIRNSGFQSLRERYFGMQSLMQDSEISQLIFQDIYELTSELDLLRIWESSSDMSQLRRMQEFDVSTYLPGDLMFKADMASMANSLELRSPLLDYRVVEFGLTLPDSFKVHRGVSKRILRELLYEYVPRELVDRPKMGFGIPQAEWLREELSGLVQETLFSKDSWVGNWLNMSHLRSIVEEHKSGTNRDRIIWPVLMLEIWAKNWLG